jgi:hypothetical protein
MKDSETAAAQQQAPAPFRQFGESAPFLEQSRAQNTLRHELERLFQAVEARVDDATARDGDVIAECTALPNRIIARCGARAISFSWLTGRLGGVSDGYLLVIEWTGVAPRDRGAGVLKSATPSRETSYCPEAEDAASWRWRAGQQSGRSTLDLVNDWFGAVVSAPRARLAEA